MWSSARTRALTAAVGALVILGGLLAAPNLIDWTEYRGAFATRLSAATGRAATIDGDVDFVLLPRPAFNAEAVHFGADLTTDFVAVEQLSAHLAFFPLLRGQLQFHELVLRRPEAHLTRGTDGSLAFLRPLPQESLGSPAGGAGSSAAAVHLDVDRLRIEGGTILFRDLADGSTLRVQGIDLSVIAGPLAPVSMAGEFSIGNVSLAADITVGWAGSDARHPVSATLKLLEAEATAKFTGAVTLGAQGWDARGDLRLSGDSASAPLAAFGIIGADTPTPGAVRRPFVVSAKINADRESVTADPLTLDIGGTPAKGAAKWAAAAGDGTPGPKLDMRIEFGAVQIEAWRFAEGAAPVVDAFSVIPAARGQEATRPAAFRDIQASFDIRAPVLAYRGQTLRGGIFAAALSQGELRISHASVELPAATRLKVFGFARWDGAPVFDGAVEMQTGDLRSLMDWLGANPDPNHVLPGRFSNASFRAALQGTPERLTLGDVIAVVDTSMITGRMSSSRRQGATRATFGVDLAINTVNFDTYLPLLKGRPRPSDTAASTDPQAQKPAGYGVTPVFPAFAGLAAVDADLRLQVDAITAGGVANGKIGLDVGLKDGVLKVRSASFDNVGGIAAWFSGSIAGFGVTPRFEDVQFDLSTADPVKAGRALGFDLPAQLRTLAPVAVTGVINGTLAQVDGAATLKVAGLTVHAEGRALTPDQHVHLSLNVEAALTSYAALMRAAGVAWPATASDPGALKFSAQVVHEKSATKIESIALRIGENSVSGNLGITHDRGQPEVTGALNGIALAMDKLWPKEPALQLVPARPGAGRVAPTKPTPLRPVIWSEDPLDWSFLKGWRAGVSVSGASFSLRGIQVQDFNCRLTVADGAMEIADWNGKVFGSPGQIYLRLAALPTPLVQGEIAFLAGDLAAVAGAVSGGSPGQSGGLKSGGKADFAGSFRAQGASLAALVADLSGAGTVKVTATEAGTGPIAGLLGAVAAAHQLEGMTGGAARGGAVTLESRFSASEGRIKVEDATVASRSYGGAFAGAIDLSRWQVDLSGRLRLESRAGGDGARPSAVPMTIKGALDAPNIALLPSAP